jgi:inhibitor of cysteine peptidase
VKESATAIRLTERDHRRKVRVRTGRRIELRLQENPTSGFRWRLVQAGEPVCSLLRSRFEPGSKPGQPGTQCWRFEIVAAGSARIELIYRRSWQAVGTVEDRFTVDLHCRTG